MIDLSGQYLGRYYLSERLGEGGMAIVYKAYDTRLERDVAIKIIRSGAFPPDAVAELLKRFEREAKSLAKLSHPNIVKVHDYGEHEGSPYLVMEYLPGGTLKKLLVKPLPWQDAIRLLLPIARSVAYAHQRGILHRDIKPANILITESGESMLSDFGIAKLFEADQATALTGSGMAIGTPEYMAPEQWTGITSPQSDLYSLGIVLYEMVTGRKPYMADTPAAILIKQATEPLPTPRKFAMDLPEDFEFVLIKALAKEPDHRFKDVNAFIKALENLHVGVSVVPLEEKNIEKTYKVPLQEPAPTEIMPKGNNETVRAVEAAKKDLKEDAEHKAAESIPSGKREPQPVRKDARAIIFPNLFTTLKSIRLLPVLGIVGLLVGIFATLMFLSVNQESPSTSTTASTNLSLIFSGVSGNEVNIYLYDIENGTTSPVDLGGGKNWGPVMNNLGNLYFTSNREDDKAEIYRLVSNEVKRVTHTPGQFESWGPVFSNTGSMYFTSNREDGKAEIYRLENNEVKRVTNTSGQFESWGPAFSNTGSMYFTSNREDGKAEIYRLVNGKTERVTSTPGQFESWSPMFLGRSVFFSSNRSSRNRIHLLNRQADMISEIETLPNFSKEPSPNH